MTQREKTLAAGLIVVLGIGASFGALWYFALEPYKEVKDRVQSAEQALSEKEGELANEQAQIGSILKVDPRLTQWNDVSLPPRDPKLKRGQPMTDEQKKRHINQLQVDYEKYLRDMMERNRFRTDSIVIMPGQVEKATVAKGKQPTYERIAFRVAGRGELAAVTGLMEEFHKAPLLHQIRAATVELANQKGSSKSSVREGDLDLKMTVEALMVTDAQQKERTSLLPPKLAYPLRVMADPPRNYALLSDKNVFTGVKPPVVKTDTKPQPKDDKDKKPTRKEDRTEVLRFVRLTMLCYDPDRDRWEATVYDLAKGGNETKLNTGVRKELTVYDRFEQVSLDARVVYIDEKQLIFKDLKDKKFYRLRCGDFVYPAIREALRSSELKELGISAD
jgi:predicted DNA-binding protein with PD1-like motif